MWNSQSSKERGFAELFKSVWILNVFMLFINIGQKSRDFSSGAFFSLWFLPGFFNPWRVLDFLREESNFLIGWVLPAGSFRDWPTAELKTHFSSLAHLQGAMVRKASGFSL
jgi:hypothetical protein